MRDACSLVVGFDFGTSFSKVVVRNLLTNQSETIRFPMPGTAGDTALLPTILSVADGYLVPVFGGASEGHVPYVKMLAKALFREGGESPLVPSAVRELAEGRDTKEVIVDLLAWYFAHVLAAVEKALPETGVVGERVWDNSYADDYVGVQLCIPVGDMQDKQLLNAMDEALQLAYVLRGSVDPEMREALEVEQWFGFCREARGYVEKYDMSNVCFTYPEVSAGIQTVLQSSTARDGIYITMDVGAGTVDLNAFLRFTARRDIPLSYLASSVVPLGVQRLESHSSVDPYDTFHIPGWHVEGFPMKALNEKQLGGQLRTALTDLVARGKQKQPNLGDMDGLRTWDSPNVYMWGGGSAVDTYGNVLTETLADDLKIHRVDVMHLPMANDLDVPAGVDFGRIAIGYGLSFHPANLDKIKLPSELPNRRPPRRRKWVHPQDLQPGDLGFSWTMNGTD